jgi:nephrocystin-3
MSGKTKTEPSRKREIRVFISSTFRDLQEEREELVKHVFPKLRKLCEDRGVSWREIDLRWGVTEDRAERGEVLRVCLTEIERCRPYFIGILAERYGSVPKEIPPELIEDQKWIDKNRDRSLTELEIIYGVLENPSMAERARFYFRDPTYVERVPPERRVDCTEDDPAARAKLLELKDRIRTSGLSVPVRDNYADARKLGELVLEDLTAIIDEQFPADDAPDPLDREALEHEMFAESRRDVYIARQEYFDRLDEHGSGTADGPGLVITGESGSGKSALLANWAARYRDRHPNDLVLIHFIGATPYSTNWALMLRRVMGELKRRFDIAQEVPDKPDEIRSSFANWLHMAAARGRVVLILDALNQLEDREGAPDLVWLPPLIPGNVRLIVSTLAGRPLDELKKREWPELELGALDAEERARLIRDYLQVFYGKELSPARVERIGNAPQSTNPLYLQALLEELRQFGVHELLDEHIDHYLSAETVTDLYARILERWEADYERDRPGLVKDALTLLWAARRGLLENELLELLGSREKPLPQVFWSEFLLASERSLVSRSGSIGFFHDYLRQAVAKCYLRTEASRRDAHLRLAWYFEGSELSARQIDELPWQLNEAKEWQALYELVSTPIFFMAIWLADRYDVKRYWARIEAESSWRLAQAFQPALDDPRRNPTFTGLVSILMGDMGHPHEALKLRASLVEYCREIGDRNGLQASLCNQAKILHDRGDPDGAMKLLREQERICWELGNKDALQICLCNQAVILHDRGDLDDAMKLYKEVECICHELGNKDGLSNSLCGQALVLQDRGELDGAMKLLREQERICRELGNKDGIQASFCNQANILYARGDFDGAMKLHKEQERICCELGDKHRRQASLGNQANILYARGELDGAMKLYKEQERICRELGNKDGLSISLGNQALILEARGDLDGALKLHKEEESVCHELGNVNGLQRSLGNQASILYAHGDFDVALRLYKEQERICRELENKAGLQVSLEGQANTLYARGDFDGALRLYKEQERICRELENKDGLSKSFCGQALILQARGDLDGAMALFKEQERICCELGSKDGLAISLSNQALILQARGDLDGAMKLYKEHEHICRELGNKNGIQASFCNQGNILYAHGDLDGAMKLYKEQERICSELGNIDWQQRSLGGQANILYARGDLDGAMKLYKEQERICRELGSIDGLRCSLANQANVLKASGDLDGSMKLHKEEERMCRELGNIDGLAISLANQAILLTKSKGCPHEAFPLIREACRLAERHGLVGLLKRIEPILNYVQSKLRE